MTGPVKPKWTEIDPTLPPGHIKVLSRTLFVGGANGSEQDLRAIFSRFGDVQTCIVNNDKRHAFVKMYNRQDAVNAKTGMEHMTDSDVLHKARQVSFRRLLSADTFGDTITNTNSYRPSGASASVHVSAVTTVRESA